MRHQGIRQLQRPGEDREFSCVSSNDNIYQEEKSMKENKSEKTLPSKGQTIYQRSSYNRHAGAKHDADYSAGGGADRESAALCGLYKASGPDAEGIRD